MFGSRVLNSLPASIRTIRPCQWPTSIGILGLVGRAHYSSLCEAEAPDLALEDKLRLRRDRQRERRATDPTYRERINAYRRERYATDTAYREKLITSSRDRRATDAEWREKENARRRQRWATDPEFCEKEKVSTRERKAANPEIQDRINMRRRERRQSDAEFRERENAYVRKRRATDANFRAMERAWRKASTSKPDETEEAREQRIISRRLRMQTNPQIRYTEFYLALFLQKASTEHWTWKTHELVWYPERVEHHCTTCHRNTPLKIWFRPKINPEVLECRRCFTRDTRCIPENISPTKYKVFRDIAKYEREHPRHAEPEAWSNTNSTDDQEGPLKIPACLVCSSIVESKQSPVHASP